MNHLDVLAGLWPNPPLPNNPLTSEDEKLIDQLSKAIVRDEGRNNAALRELVQPELWS